MVENNKPNPSDPEPSDVSGAGGGDDVESKKPDSTSSDSPQSEAGKGEELLDFLNSTAGREGDNAFKSQEDFVKHYKNLSSLVGKKDSPDPKPAVQDSDPKDQPEKGESGSDAALEANKKTNDRLDEIEFLNANPDVKEDLDILKQLAGDKSLADAYADEEIQKTLTDLRSGREQRNADTSIESNNRVGTPTKDVSDELLAKVRSGDSDAREEFVRKTVLKDI